MSLLNSALSNAGNPIEIHGVTTYKTLSVFLWIGPDLLMLHSSDSVHSQLFSAFFFSLPSDYNLRYSTHAYLIFPRHLLFSPVHISVHNSSTLQYHHIFPVETLATYYTSFFNVLYHDLCAHEVKPS